VPLSLSFLKNGESEKKNCRNLTMLERTKQTNPNRKIIVIRKIVTCVVAMDVFRGWHSALLIRLMGTTLSTIPSMNPRNNRHAHQIGLIKRSEKDKADNHIITDHWNPAMEVPGTIPLRWLSCNASTY
jgi:hypothetical protein